jgi:K+-sensing histidine kinase KdpD
VAAALLIATESLGVYLLKQMDPGNVFGVIFLLGALAVATVWGFRLGVVTSLASAVVYVYFHRMVTGRSFIPAEAQDAVAVLVFLFVALSAAALAALGRSRAVEADLRRREAETSRDELGVLASSRRRCAGWRHWSRVGSPRLRCSRRRRRSWPDSWVCTPRLWSAIRPTAHPSSPAATRPV